MGSRVESEIKASYSQRTETIRIYTFDSNTHEESIIHLQPTQAAILVDAINDAINAYHEAHRCD